jgi:hypothetical protein
MKVRIVNENNKLFVLDSDDNKYRMLHKYLRRTKKLPTRINQWEAEYKTENEKYGVVVALQDMLTGNVIFGFSRVSDKVQEYVTMDKKGRLQVEEFKDEFNPRLGLEIAAGKALSGKDVKFPFHNSVVVYEDLEDNLWDVYNLVQKIWLKPSKFKRDKLGNEQVREFISQHF